MVEGKGIEPLTQPCKGHMFPLAPTPHETIFKHITLVLVAAAEQHRSVFKYCSGCPTTCRFYLRRYRHLVHLEPRQFEHVYRAL